MNPSAIQSAHLNRLAVVYGRQSTPLQVEQHPESRLRQYQLTERATSFGWPTQRCVVIDDDLGISGAQSSNRPGYQRLVSMVALCEVGVVCGLGLSARPQLPGLVPTAGAGSGIQRPDRR